MLGSHPISAVLGADIAATSDTASFGAYVKALSECGLSVMLCQRESKIPADYRTPKQKKDDLAAYAEATGDESRDDPPGGVHMATNDVNRLRSYVKRYRKEHGDEAPVNLAIEVGTSKVLVVDCDTMAERVAFCDWWASKHGDARFQHALPTVLSPGVLKDGVWVHKDGGHYYFTLDGLDVPVSTGKMTVTHNGVNFDVFWRDRYVLIPPSIRAEGPYQRVGPVLSLREHEWLHREIHLYAASRQIKPAGAGKLSEHNLDALVTWYHATSWGDLLVPEGWEWTGTDKTCGCPIWGRPGGRSSDKSATAHEPGCANSRYNSDDPPIHFWTSQPGDAILAMLHDVGSGATTLSKLQLYAALKFDRNISKALRSMPGMQSPARRSMSVVVPGMPFCTSVIVEVDEDDEDVIVTDSYSYDDGGDYPDIERVTPPIATTTTVTNPFTEALAPPHVHTHVEGGQNSGDVLQKSLVQPAAIQSPENSGVPSEILTTGVTPSVTDTVPTGVTPIVTGGVTESEALHYEQRYETLPTTSQHVAVSTPVPVQGHHFQSPPQKVSADVPTSPPPRLSVVPNHRADIRPRVTPATYGDDDDDYGTPALAPVPVAPAPSVGGANPFASLAAFRDHGAPAASTVPSFGTSGTAPVAPAAVAPVQQTAPAPTTPMELSDTDVDRIANRLAEILGSKFGQQ